MSVDGCDGRRRQRMIALIVGFVLLLIAITLVQTQRAARRAADSARGDTTCVAAKIGLPCNSPMQ